MMSSRPIHTVACGRISVLFQGSVTFHCVDGPCVVRPPVDGHWVETPVAARSSTPRNTSAHTSALHRRSALSARCPEAGSLDHTVRRPLHLRGHVPRPPADARRLGESRSLWVPWLPLHSHTCAHSMVQVKPPQPLLQSPRQDPWGHVWHLLSCPPRNLPANPVGSTRMGCLTPSRHPTLHAGA